MIKESIMTIPVIIIALCVGFTGCASTAENMEAQRVRP